MTVGYRAILGLPSKTDAVARVEQQLRSWLKEKKNSPRSTVEIADWDGPGVHELGPDATFLVVHGEANDELRRTYRLREENKDGVFVMTVHVLDRRPGARAVGDVVVIEVGKEGVDEETASKVVRPPRFVKDLLDVEPATNGSLRLTPAPERLPLDDVDGLVDALSDPGRTAAVIVASVPAGEHAHRWSKVIDSLTRGSVGVASIYVLERDALERLNDALPASHGVPEGFVRTYLPEVDLTSAEDGRRHLFLTANRLVRSVTRDRVAAPLQDVHAVNLRRIALRRSLPRDVRRALDLLARDEQQVLRRAEVSRRIRRGVTLDAPVAAVVDEVAKTEPVIAHESIDAPALTRWPKRIVALIRTWLQREDETDAAVDALHTYISTQVSEKDVAIQQLDEAAAQDEAHVAQIADLNRRIDDLEFDLAVQGEESRSHARAARTYADRLRAEQRFDELHIEDEPAEWAAPDSVATLVDRLDPTSSDSPLLHRVVFTGDKAAAVEVDSRDMLSRYAPALWEFVRVLHDYAEAKAAGFRGNVHMYLDGDVAGHKCSKERHAATESDSVKNNRALRSQRMLPVPSSVDTSRRVMMAAHFKPTHSDQFAPRMHYFDDVERSGKIYIGYIGRHLTNTKTN